MFNTWHWPVSASPVQAVHWEFRQPVRKHNQVTWFCPVSRLNPEVNANHKWQRSPDLKSPVVQLSSKGIWSQSLLLILVSLFFSTATCPHNTSWTELLCPKLHLDLSSPGHRQMNATLEMSDSVLNAWI